MIRRFLGALAVAALAFAGPAAAQDAGTTSGAWLIRTVVDPITDARRGIATLEGEHGRLVVKCDAPGPGSVYIHFISNEYLGGDYDRRQMVVRFDQAPPATQTWHYNGSAALLTTEPLQMGFVRQLAAASRLVLRATTYRGASVTAVFEIDPVTTAEAMRQVLSTCNSGEL